MNTQVKYVYPLTVTSLVRWNTECNIHM